MLKTPNSFKNKMKKYGKQLNMLLKFGKKTIIDKKYIKSAEPSVNGEMFTSVMRQMVLEIEKYAVETGENLMTIKEVHESKINSLNKTPVKNLVYKEIREDILLASTIDVQLGVRISEFEDYEYIDYGEYVVYDKEDVVDKNSMKLYLFDHLIDTHIKYDDDPLQLDFKSGKITVLKLLQAICDKFGFILKTTDFANANKVINEDKYAGLDYTYRDILDEISAVAGGFIKIFNKDLYVAYPEETGEVIDENDLEKLTIGKKIGAFNSLVLGRSPQEDNIYYPSNMKAEDRVSMRIDNNQIMDKNREDFIINIFNKINGLEYYVFEFTSFGFGYFEFGDIVTLKNLKKENFKTILFNVIENIDSGIKGKSYTEETNYSETKYEYATGIEKRLRNTEIICDKQEGKITQLVEETTENSNKLSKQQQDIDSITSTVREVKEEVKQKTDDINNNLKQNYFTKTETQSEIKQTAESITSEVSKSISEAKQEAIDSSNTATDNKLKKYSTTTEMNSAITQKANEITQKVSQVETKIETVEGKVDVAQQTANTANSNAQSAQQTANEANKAAQNAQETADDAVTEITTTNTKVTELQQTVDGFKQSVSAVEEQVTTVQSKVDEAQSSANKANEKIDGLQVGSRNLALNTKKFFDGNFSGSVGGTAWSSGTKIVEEDDSTPCGFALKLTYYAEGKTVKEINSISIKDLNNLQVKKLSRDYNNTAGGYMTAKDLIGGLDKLIKGETYTVSFWIKASREAQLVMSNIVEGQTIIEQNSDGIIGTQWQKIVIVFKWTNTSKLTSCFYIKSPANTTIWLSSYMLEKGTIPTDWTPAPEDIENTLETNYYTKTETNSQITQTADEIKQSVSKTITTAKEEAIKSANDSTDSKLTKYSTTVEMNSAIDLKYNEITLEVSKSITTAKQEAINSANSSTDTKLKSYSTTTEMNAAIKLKTDAITLEVNKKVNESDFGTKIEQNYSHVKIAWNNISKYIQFESGELRIYDSASTSSQKLRSVFNYSGEHFYRDDYYVGSIGTNQWASNNSHKGLTFDLDYQGKYMAFAQKETSSSSSYNTMLCFSRANSIYDEYGVHLGCDLYGHYYTLSGFKIGSISAGGYSAFTGAIPIVTRIESGEDGAFSWWHSNLRVYNGIIVGYWND